MFQFLGIRTLSQVKQGTRCVKYIGSDGILKPYVANVAMILWGCDLIHQWNTQINIPTILETNHKLMCVSREKIIQGFIKNSHWWFRLYNNSC